MVLAIIGAALTRLMLYQGRMFDHQNAGRGARAVSRGAVNLLVSDLRMVDASAAAGDTGAVVAAGPRAVTVRVPYALGIVCAVGAGSVTASLLPVDSSLAAIATLSGYAWRDTVTGKYHYVEVGAAASGGSAATCAGGGVTALPGGSVVALSPVPGASPAAGAISVGTPVFLVRRVTYEFKNSAALPGRVGLWRTVSGAASGEELAAPFDSSAKFRFFVLDADTAQPAPPAALADIRGLELVLDARSERAPQGTARPRIARLTTAVFFKNRLD